MKSVFQFITCPIIALSKPITSGDKRKILFQSIKSFYFLIFVSGIIIALVSFLFEYLTKVDFYKNVFIECDDYLKKEYNDVLYYSIVIIGIPIFEECAYRLYLRPTKVTVATSLGLIFLHFTVNLWYYPAYARIETYIFLLISIAICFVAYYSISGWLIVQLNGKYFRFLFYFSALLFGLIHLPNFTPLNLPKTMLWPIIVLPQLMGGLVLGYIRLKNGLAWAIFLHGIINTVASLFAYIKHFAS